MTYNQPAREILDNVSICPDLGSPEQLALIMGGNWTSLPKVPVTAIRHRLDTIEDSTSGFLFAPELFSRVNSTAGRLALLNAYKAIESGAAGMIVSSRPPNLAADFPCLIVKDPALAIERLALNRRKMSQAAFFAVTGSVGKTTTRNMIHRMASVVGPTHRSIANYNDGMASINFTLAGLSPFHQHCVVEFSEVGQLDDQARLYQPQLAVITNILPEHLNRMERSGYSGGQAIQHLAFLAAGVARQMQLGGYCILNADEENFDLVAAEVRKSPHALLRTCGKAEHCDVQILSIKCHDSHSDVRILIEGRDHSYRLGIPGQHMAVNSVLAAAAIHFSGQDLAAALPVLADFHPESRRGTRYRFPWGDGFVTFIDESFSSSVPSMRATLRQLEKEKVEGQGRRIAVLGQVNGMGKAMPQTMAALAREVEQGNIARFFSIGSDIRLFNEAITDRGRVANHFQTLAKLEGALRAEIAPGDVVLFKGTNKPAIISLRRLVDRLVSPASAATTVNSDGPDCKRLVIGGDTYFGEYYQEKRAKAADTNYLQCFGYGYSSERIRSLFERADFAMVNLECTLTERRESSLRNRKDFILHGHPTETINALKSLKVDGVLLGNNHAMDYTAEGLEDMLSALAEGGLQVSGAGMNRELSQRPITRTLNVDGIGFKVAVISAYEFNSGHEDMGYYAGPDKPGVNNINIDRIGAQVATLKSEGYFVIISPHWGSNYCFRTYFQSRLAERLVDCGADLILGHGPHMMNEIAQVNGVWVAYSLGNLIFNSEGEYERRGVQPYSLIAEIEVSRRGSGLTAMLNLYPIISCNQLTQFQPTFADDEQFERVVQMLSASHYDRDVFFSGIACRKRDGRNFMSVKLF